MEGEKEGRESGGGGRKGGGEGIKGGGREGDRRGGGSIGRERRSKDREGEEGEQKDKGNRKKGKRAVVEEETDRERSSKASTLNVGKSEEPRRRARAQRLLPSRDHSSGLGTQSAFVPRHALVVHRVTQPNRRERERNSAPPPIPRMPPEPGLRAATLGMRPDGRDRC